MWGKRAKRGKHRAGLPRQLSLGLLEDAMGRAEQQEQEEEAAATGQAAEQAEQAEQAGRATAAPYLGSVPPQVTPPKGVSLQPADVPVDNSTAPPADAAVPPAQRQRSDERTGKSTRPGSLV
jgi:hypothetical protein